MQQKKCISDPHVRWASESGAHMHSHKNTRLFCDTEKRRHLRVAVRSGSLCSRHRMARCFNVICLCCWSGACSSTYSSCQWTNHCRMDRLGFWDDDSVRWTNILQKMEGNRLVPGIQHSSEMATKCSRHKDKISLTKMTRRTYIYILDVSCMGMFFSWHSQDINVQQISH